MGRAMGRFGRSSVELYLVRHVALGAGNVLHDVAEAHLEGVRLLLEQLVALLGAHALRLCVCVGGGRGTRGLDLDDDEMDWRMERLQTGMNTTIPQNPITLRGYVPCTWSAPCGWERQSRRRPTWCWGFGFRLRRRRGCNNKILAVLLGGGCWGVSGKSAPGGKRGLSRQHTRPVGVVEGCVGREHEHGWVVGLAWVGRWYLAGRSPIRLFFSGSEGSVGVPWGPPWPQQPPRTETRRPVVVYRDLVVSAAGVWKCGQTFSTTRHPPPPPHPATFFPSFPSHPTTHPHHTTHHT